MKIAVLVKVVSDYEVPSSDFELKGNRVKDRYNKMIGLYDEHAVELAIQIAEKSDAQVEIISYGDKSDVSVLRKALAMGADSLIMIDGKNDDPSVIAFACSKIIKEKGYDLVLAGRQSSDLERGIVPALTASMLDIPYIPIVKQIDVSGDELMLVKQIKGGILKLKASVPIVLSITDDPTNVPRIPAVRGILKAKRKPVSYETTDSTGDSGMKEISVEVPNIEYKCEILPSDDINEAANALVENLKKEHLL